MHGDRERVSTRSTGHRRVLPRAAAGVALFTAAVALGVSLYVVVRPAVGALPDPLPASAPAPPPLAIDAATRIEWAPLEPPPLEAGWWLIDAGDRVLASDGRAVARTFDGRAWTALGDLPGSALAAWQDTVVAATPNDGRGLTILAADGSRFERGFDRPVSSAAVGPERVLVLTGGRGSVREPDELHVFGGPDGWVRVPLGPENAGGRRIIATSAGYLLLGPDMLSWSTDGLVWVRGPDPGEGSISSMGWPDTVWSDGPTLLESPVRSASLEPSRSTALQVTPTRLLEHTPGGPRVLAGGAVVAQPASGVGGAAPTGDGPLGRFRLDALVEARLQLIPDDGPILDFPLPDGFGRTGQESRVLVTGRAVFLFRPGDGARPWWVGRPVPPGGG